MYARLAQKWAPKDEWQLIDLENSYFIVRFKSEEDRDFALTGGPWIIAGKYLVVQQWHLDFDAKTTKIRLMAVWIRISGLPMQYMDENALTVARDFPGKTYKVDVNSAIQVRGRYARLCVKVDLDKPLRTFLRFGQKVCKLEYEGLDQIYFSCRRFGHRKDFCKSGEMQSMNEESQQVNQTEPSKNVSPPEFGSWMQVPFNPRGRKPGGPQVMLGKLKVCLGRVLIC